MSIETPGGAKVSELVWDIGMRGTAFNDAGMPLPITASSGWSPELLLATSAAASLMIHFLELAAGAGLEVLGYVSRQRVTGRAGVDLPSIEITPSIVVPSEQAADLARNLFRSAQGEARVVRMLEPRPTVDVEISVVRDRRDPLPPRGRS